MIEECRTTLAQIRATPLSEKQRTCEWLCDEDGIWHTGCGQVWVFDDGGTLKDHHVKFCYHCGAHAVDPQYGNEEKGK
jgi:hypothetical protein